MAKVICASRDFILREGTRLKALLYHWVTSLVSNWAAEIKVGAAVATFTPAGQKQNVAKSDTSYI